MKNRNRWQYNIIRQRSSTKSPTTNIILNGSLQVHLLSLMLFNTGLKFLTSAIRQEKGITPYRSEKKKYNCPYDRRHDCLCRNFQILSKTSPNTDRQMHTVWQDTRSTSETWLYFYILLLTMNIRILKNIILVQELKKILTCQSNKTCIGVVC